MSEQTIPAAPLRAFVEQVLLGVGYAPEEAADGARVLLWASLRGIDTHGVRNLGPYYVDRLRDGMLIPRVDVTVETETDHSACLNGNSGLGLATACRAMRLAIAKGAATGVGIVTVRNTHHLGPAGYFASLAAEHDMLGICMTGHFFGAGNEYGIAPINARHPMFSTNPLAFAAPAGDLPPVVLDMASSIVPVNRAELYAESGRAIPVGWALDQHGQVTTDGASARQFLPLGGSPEWGGHKGVALAMMVSILSGVLSGGWSPVSSDKGSDEELTSADYAQPTMGHFFAAIRIDSFLPITTFQAGLDAMLRAITDAPRQDENEPILYPGLREDATARSRQRDGIPLPANVAANLHQLADELHLAWPPRS